MSYSTKFKNIISDQERVRKLINGSSYSGAHFESWENARKFIGQAVHKDGTILDVGCANGFLLLCLQEWSAHKLEPFGIDINKERIEEAKNIFTRHKENFIEQNATDFSELPLPFPKKFDIIFWSVWETWEFELPEEIRALNAFLRLVGRGGRFIMAFYDGAERAARQIKRIKELGLKVSRTVQNPTGIEMLTWVNA